MLYGNSVLTDAGALRAERPTQIRMPSAADGPAIWKLIEATPALDSNSLYCNLLQASHFAATCAIAERDGQIVGWLSGYVPPERGDTLFVWQVCVGEAARGQGLGKRLIAHVLARPTSSGIRHLDCTITEDNTASWALFGSVARGLDAQMVQAEHFSRDTHFDGAHASELAVSIGPFTSGQVAALAA
ncbi:MAG: diaminobutyrate acetyltransferase [Alphaproteobacteria bacterium]|nr:diaminobutyrate acetyltransferase [Alphaproteobacteria bacterium]